MLNHKFDDAAQLFSGGAMCRLSASALQPSAVRRFLAALFTAVLIVTTAIAWAADTAQPTLPTMQLEVNGKVLTAEIASTSQQRYMGLSFRQSLDKDTGMLFVYSEEQTLTFTMRNTLIPLSIAFLSEDLVINEIHHMNVGPGQLFGSRQKAQYALEVDQGWFAANNIKAGDQLTPR